MQQQQQPPAVPVQQQPPAVPVQQQQTPAAQMQLQLSCNHLKHAVKKLIQSRDCAVPDTLFEKLEALVELVAGAIRDQRKETEELKEKMKSLQKEVERLHVQIKQLKEEAESNNNLRESLIVGQLANKLEQEIVTRVLDGTGTSRKLLTIASLEDALDDNPGRTVRRIFDKPTSKDKANENWDRLEGHYTFLDQSLYYAITSCKGSLNVDAHPNME